MSATCKDIRRDVRDFTGEHLPLFGTSAGSTNPFTNVVRLVDREDNPLPNPKMTPFAPSVSTDIGFAQLPKVRDTIET